MSGAGEPERATAEVPHGGVAGRTPLSAEVVSRSATEDGPHGVAGRTPPSVEEGPRNAVQAQGTARTDLRVAIVAANTFEHDSRLLRTARALAADGHRVTLIAFAAPGLPSLERLPSGVEVRRVEVERRIVAAFRPLPSLLGRLLARALGFDPESTVLPSQPPRGPDRLRAPLRRAVEILAHQRRVGPWRETVLGAVPDADVYHCKALIALPVIRGAAQRARGRFVYDLADLHTEAARLARMPAAVRAIVRRREAGWLQGAAFLTAVSDAVADEAVRRFRVPRPVVVLNCPPAWQPDVPAPPASRRLRDALNLTDERPIVLYQGGFSVDRGVEELVAAADQPALRDLDAAVVFLGYGRLRDWLTEQAGLRQGRLFVVDAVPPGELLEWTASADLGFVGQPPRTLNQRLNLSNKVFEYLMAGVPALVAAGTEHCRLVGGEALGRCCEVDDPAAIAREAAALLSVPAYERARLRAHCRSVALEQFTWERQQSGLVEAYRALAGRIAGDTGHATGAFPAESPSVPDGPA